MDQKTHFMLYRDLSGVVAWLDFPPVIPLFIHGIQLKISILLIFLVVFWIPWSSHGMTLNVFFNPCNKANFIANLGEILDDVHRQILSHHYDSLDDQNLSVTHLVRLNVIYL